MVTSIARHGHGALEAEQKNGAHKTAPPAAPIKTNIYLLFVLRNRIYPNRILGQPTTEQFISFVFNQLHLFENGLLLIESASSACVLCALERHSNSVKILVNRLNRIVWGQTIKTVCLLLPPNAFKCEALEWMQTSTVYSKPTIHLICLQTELSCTKSIMRSDQI